MWLLGYGALTQNTEGSYNIGIGYEGLKLNSTGASNTALGNAAGNVITTGSQNVLLGADTDPSANDGTNQTVVGYGATGQANNSVTLGNADITAVYMAQDAGATIWCHVLKHLQALYQMHQMVQVHWLSGFQIYIKRRCCVVNLGGASNITLSS